MNKIQKFINIFLLISFPFFVSGYGYMGDLPELGDKSKEKYTIQQQEAQLKKEKEFQEIKPISIIAPRASAGYKINKYSAYLSDIKEIEYLLKEIKTVLQTNTKNKVQLYCAKTNLLNLHMDVLKGKYNDQPEKNYESYKQLVILNTYLTEITDYKIATDKLRETQKGTLEDKIKDEKFLRQKAEKALVPINTVIEIIKDTNY